MRATSTSSKDNNQGMAAKTAEQKAQVVSAPKKQLEKQGDGVDAARPSTQLEACTQRGELSPEDDMVCTNKNRANSKVKALCKCRRCNLVQVTLYRALNKDQPLRGKYNNMTAEEKREWVTTHSGSSDVISAAGLTAKLQETFSATSSQSTKRTGEQDFKTLYDWYDETDLKSTFSSKPDTVQSVLAHAPNVECHVTKRTMYGVPKYASATTETAKTETNTEMSIATEGKVTAPKEKRPRTS